MRQPHVAEVLVVDALDEGAALLLRELEVEALSPARYYESQDAATLGCLAAKAPSTGTASTHVRARPIIVCRLIMCIVSFLSSFYFLALSSHFGIGRNFASD